MFVAERLIYLQLQKTGCTHVAELLAKCIPGRQVGKHNWLARDVPDKYLVGSVRNPWDWYVSLWAFGCAGRGGFRSRVTTSASDHHQPTAIIAASQGVFETIVEESAETGTDLPVSNRSQWEATYGDSSDPELFRAWLKLMFAPKTRNDFFGPGGQRPINDLVGLFTFRYLRLYCRNANRLFRGPFASMAELRRFDRDNDLLDAVIRTESLESDLIRVLCEAGYRLTRQQVDMIESAAEDKRNATRHQPAGFYYDRETIELVARHEQLIVGKYAYKPPQPE